MTLFPPRTLDAIGYRDGFRDAITGDASDPTDSRHPVYIDGYRAGQHKGTEYLRTRSRYRDALRETRDQRDGRNNG